MLVIPNVKGSHVQHLFYVMFGPNKCMRSLASIYIQILTMNLVLH
jgi:hypothetical protein